MRIGMNISIDVTKLNKERFYQGKNGKYANLTAFIDTQQQSEYGDNGTVSQSTSKEERESGVKMPIAGNVKVFYKADEDGQKQSAPAASGPADGDIPW